MYITNNNYIKKITWLDNGLSKIIEFHLDEISYFIEFGTGNSKHYKIKLKHFQSQELVTGLQTNGEIELDKETWENLKKDWKEYKSPSPLYSS